MAPPSSNAAQEFERLLTLYYQAYARKDIEALSGVWHPRGPVRYMRNLLEVEFERNDLALRHLQVRNARTDPGGGAARAIVDLRLTNLKTRAVRTERRVRDFTFLFDETLGWRIWNEAPVGAQLATRLLSVPAAERPALIEAEPELASDDALAGLSTRITQAHVAMRLGEALDLLALQGDLAKQIGNTQVLARSLVDRGSILQALGSLKQASANYQEARTLYASLDDVGQVAACDSNLGTLAYVQGQHAEAVALLSRALEAFERLKDEPRTASALHGLGNALYMQTEFTRALDHYRRALTLIEKRGEPRAQASLLQAMAMVHREMVDYPNAIEAWSRSLTLHEGLKDQVGVARCWGGLAEIYKLQGDLARALEHQMKSLAAWERTIDPPNRAAAHFAVGQLYAIQRNFTKALEWYQKALDLDRGIRDDPGTSMAGQARDLGGMGGAHFSLGQPDPALDEYQQSLALREKGVPRDDVAIMWTLVHIGVVHASQSRYDEALASYKRAMEIAEGRSDDSAVCSILALRAYVELSRGEADTAVATATRAAEIATSEERLDAFVYARTIAGRAMQKLERVDEARAALEQAISTIPKIPTGPAAETFFTDRRGAFAAMVDLLASQGRHAEAFQWNERGRQQALADLLGGDGAIVVRDTTQTERDEERRLTRDSRTVTTRIRRERGRQTPDEKRLGELQAELARVQTERDALRRKLFDAHPRLAQQRAQGEAATVEASAPLLSAGTAIVSYVVGELRTWVFVLAANREGQAGVQQAVCLDVKATDLAEKIRKYREAISQQAEDTAKLSGDLHTLLVAPVQAALSEKTRLVVVPDALLWALPFEALQAPSGRYLIEQAAISYASSVTALLAASTLPVDPGARRAVVAIANPVVAKDAEERLAVARPGVSLQPDPATERDVRALGLLFGAARTTTYLKEQARIDRLAQGVPAGAVVHLAAPTLLGEASPLFSLFVCSPIDAADASKGLVEIVSLLNWTVPADTVVLPRADAGPSAGGGEALTALSWSLFVSGTPTLVINRWPAPEQGSEMITRFYRAVLAPTAAGRPPAVSAEALQRAIKGLLGQAATSHPFHWAGYMVMGR